MKMHDERYVLSITASHKAVRLRDHQTGEIHEWTGTRALYDALGVLADWRERDTNAHKAGYGATCRHCPEPTTGPVACTGECGIPSRPIPSGVQGGSWVNDETGVPGSYTATPHCGVSRCPTCGDDGTAGFGKIDNPVCINVWHLGVHRNPDYVRDYAVPEIKCPACGVTGGMPHDCETAGRIS